MRPPLAIGSGKRPGTRVGARALAGAPRAGLKRPRGVELVVCPPFTALATVAEILAGSPIQLGAQTCHHEAAGAHTGEVSPPMLADVGAQLVLLGHSERRRELGETDAQINLKVQAALAHGLTPVLCVGESEEERRQRPTFPTP